MQPVIIVGFRSAGKAHGANAHLLQGGKGIGRIKFIIQSAALTRKPAWVRSTDGLDGR